MRVSPYILIGIWGVALAGCSGEQASTPETDAPAVIAQPAGFDASRDCPGKLLNGTSTPYYSELPRNETAAIDWMVANLEENFGPLTTEVSDRTDSRATYRLDNARGRAVGELLVHEVGPGQYELAGGSWCSAAKSN